MPRNLVQKFSSVDARTKEDLADLPSPRSLSLSVLLIAKDKYRKDWLTADDIKACAEAAGVTVNRLSVVRALANARGAVTTSRNDEDETVYKLMTRGRREIESTLGKNRMTVVRVESNQPRSVRLKLQEILSRLKGQARVCDPYYGMRTLDILDMIPKSCHVKFLTARTSERGRRLDGAIADFKRERPRIEFRLVAANSGIHDRYIVTSGQLLILGHGLKDIGSKESFVIVLDAAHVQDLVRETIQAFDTRWNQATPM